MPFRMSVGMRESLLNRQNNIHMLELKNVHCFSGHLLKQL